MTAGKSIFDEVTAKTRHRRPDTSRAEASWIVQAVPARDQFEACTLTIEQWLANSDADGHFSFIAGTFVGRHQIPRNKRRLCPCNGQQALTIPAAPPIIRLLCRKQTGFSRLR